MEDARRLETHEDTFEELDRLLCQFAADPEDELTFGRLEVLLRGRGRWELATEPSNGHGRGGSSA